MNQCWEICGDGLNFGAHACDDGNNEFDDGCSDRCELETIIPAPGNAWTCVGVVNTVCTEVCGDGRDYHHYGCDDGNADDTDGCRNNCTPNIGIKCTDGNPSPQTSRQVS